MLMRMFVANGVARLGGWLDWVAITLATRLLRKSNHSKVGTNSAKKYTCIIRTRFRIT